MITKHPFAGGRIIGGGTGFFFETSVLSALPFDRMPGVSRIHEKNVNDAGSRVDPDDDFLAELSQIRNLPSRERFWRSLASRPNLLDLVWAFELKTRCSNNIWDYIRLNNDGKDRTQECAALVAFHMPLIMDLELIGYAIAMPALRYAADIGLLRVVALMKAYDRTGFEVLDSLPNAYEGPDYVSMPDGQGGWQLYSKNDNGGYFSYTSGRKLKFDPTLKSLSVGHLQKIHDEYSHVLPDHCIIKIEQIDETCAAVSRVAIGSNAAKPRMGSGWRWLHHSKLEVERRVEAIPFKVAPTRRSWLDARRRPDGLLHEASNAGTGPRD